ncbi:MULTISPECIES: energy transducer TonB [unclassified Thioalkalivibrio]|uniref:energy transducer TonB n=1 Tax=unclassified Thioalkalivibrio TaxID=2621013 RepID=UPI0003758927|nr:MULTISPECIES: energy transducer TonB [unclassified Thioalkalivibrio]
MSVSHGILEPESPQRRGQLGPMLFLAVVAHALVILGIGFTVDPLDTPSREPLDVTWVTDPDAQAPEPEEVERIATEDQAASGEGEEVQEALAPEAEAEGVGEPEPEGIDAPLPDAGPLVMEPAQPEPEPEPEAVEAETDEAEPATPEVAEPEPIESPQAEERPSAAALMNRGLDTARAAPAEERREFSTRATRTRYLDSLAARSAPEAAYLQAWINKVERVGNLNYPDEARRRGLSGTLVLSVRLNPEGELMNIEIARSSGEPVLDQAAMRIVELAAPYAPFTEQMREEYDELVITRTWAFRRDQMEQIR